MYTCSNGAQGTPERPTKEYLYTYVSPQCFGHQVDPHKPYVARLEPLLDRN